MTDRDSAKIKGSNCVNSIAFYMHAGSGNHGCEAIVDSLVRMLREDVTLVTNSRKEDEKYLPQDVKEHLDICEERHIDRHFLTHALYYAARRVTGNRDGFPAYKLSAITGQERPGTAVSIGGDNYCYESMVQDLIDANAMLHRRGIRTVLLGCSIEPALLKKPSIAEDMKRYNRIAARESITFRALQEAGIPAEKLVLAADPAFTLPADRSAVPDRFQGTDVVGVNLSPMALDYAGNGETLRKGYLELMHWILANTGMSIALIPHVVWQRSNDLAVLQELKDALGRDAGGRVFLIPDLPAEQLKGIIGSCRYFIGARTHATIAAYSSGVPTLVLGYSVKARGIARDLFGSEEHYVLPVQQVTQPEEIRKGFTFLLEREGDIRETLRRRIPDVLKSAERNAGAISLWEE